MLTFCALLVTSSVLLGPVTARALWPFDRFSPEPSSAERVSELLSESIRIRTVNPPGDEAALAQRLARELKRAGIEHDVIRTPSPGTDSERAAVWGRVRGTGERPALILLSHLDTVPADPAEWSVDPFAGRIWGGFVWGRGALDAKGVTVTHLLALIELADAEVALDRDVIFLATPDEEAGGLLGAGWIVQHHPELLDGVGYVLTEGGGIQPSPGLDGAAPDVWGVTLTEKAPCWLELRARGRAGHSGAPSPDAAVPRLIAALDRIRRIETPIRVTAEVAEMFARLAPLAPEWDRAGFSHLPAALARNDAFRRRFLDDAGQNALVRNTISITVLEGASKTNVAPAVARAQLDVRLLPGEQCAEFAASIAARIDEPSIEIEEILSFPALASTADTPLYRAIEAVAARQPSPGLVVPRMISGFTDAHWFRERGIVAYGFVPRALPREEALRVHGVDERVAIETLLESIELTIEIVRALDETDETDGAP